MTIDPAMMVSAFLLGIGLGMMYFGGLWLTVSLSVRLRRGQAAVFAASFLLRSALAAAVFCFVAVVDGALPAGSFIGFLIARWAVADRFGPGRRAPEEEGE